MFTVLRKGGKSPSFVPESDIICNVNLLFAQDL